MRDLSLILILLSFCCSFGSMDSATLTDIIETTKGPVRGTILRTVQKSVSYSAFNGIPYGKPPLGYLRFKPPVDIESWSEVLDAVTTHNCPQVFMEKYFGSEDCLYLNVYTPKTTFNANDTDLLPVMVWIHGGGFIMGTSSPTEDGPDYLLEDNVALVYVTYRLGALGFLSVNQPNATGNAALKDQVLALKWVQQNIQKFGGDPNKITLFGQSAGSVLVELHSISDMSKGLFHRSISMSGSPLNYWGFMSQHDAVLRAFELGTHLGIFTLSPDDLLENLYTSAAEDIVKASYQLLPVNLPFTPTLEDPKVSAEVFLDQCAFRKFDTGDFFDAPHILGFTDSEAVGFLPKTLTGNSVESSDSDDDADSSGIEAIVQLAQEAQNQLNLPPLQFVKDYDEWRNRTGATAVNESLGENLIEDFLYTTINVTTDLLFILGIDQTQQFRSKGKSPVYYYRNSFHRNDALHSVFGIDVKGTGHADDLYQIFYIDDQTQLATLSPNTTLQIQKMVRMWTNFAKYADPTPDGTSDPLINTTWTPSGQEGLHLEITDSLAMQPRPIDDTVKLFQAIGNPLRKLLNFC